jgi:hypothetical protein
MGKYTVFDRCLTNTSQDEKDELEYLLTRCTGPPAAAEMPCSKDSNLQPFLSKFVALPIELSAKVFLHIFKIKMIVATPRPESSTFDSSETRTCNLFFTSRSLYQLS